MLKFRTYIITIISSSNVKLFTKQYLQNTTGSLKQKVYTFAFLSSTFKNNLLISYIFKILNSFVETLHKVIFNTLG